MMQPLWLVQNIGFSQANQDINEEMLDRLGFSYKLFGIIRNLNFVVNLENILYDPEQKYILRGGTTLLNLLQTINDLSQVNKNLSDSQLQYNEQFIAQLKASVFYHEQNFDQAHYGKMNLPLLNHDAKYYPIAQHLSTKFDREVFIKPSKDQKAFNPGFLQPGDSIKDFIFSQIHEQSYIEETAIIAPVKIILAEYRFFVVDQQVITGSRYRFANKLNISEIVPDNVLQAAQEYARLYQPHDIFTMDLAQTNQGIKIVEYNCWNASGLYKTDAMKIFDTVHEYVQGVDFRPTENTNKPFCIK